MTIHQADYIGSFVSAEAMPQTTLPEFAFAGRSNVGKSSLINMLCNRKNLARTSASPGKTRTINLYDIDGKWLLADLPGYGFAKASRQQRQEWSQIITDYLQQRTNLACVFVLLDCRLDPQKSDVDFINRMGAARLPLTLVFTKADKVSQAGQSKCIAGWAKTLSRTWEAMPPGIVTSAVRRKGRSELLAAIESLIGTRG